MDPRKRKKRNRKSRTKLYVTSDNKIWKLNKENKKKVTDKTIK